MEDAVWSEYIQWLGQRALTTGMQSRHPTAERRSRWTTARWEGGERIALENVPKVYTNEYLIG